jgi:transposase-like protein
LRRLRKLVCDGLKGFPEAIEAVFPQAAVQTCIVHLIRNSLDFVSWKDRKPVVAELRKIYRAADAEAGRKALEAFEDGSWGGKYAAIGQIWRRQWDQIIPFSPSLRPCAKSSTRRMRSTSGICAGVLHAMRASDLVTKRGVSAAIAARRPIRSLPD